MLFMQMLDDIVILRIINGSDFFCIFHAEFDASTVVYSTTGGQALAERLWLKLSTMMSNHVMHFLLFAGAEDEDDADSVATWSTVSMYAD